MFRSLRRFSTKPPAGVSSEKLLAQALKLVPQYGWEDAVVEALRAHGMSDQGVSLFSKSDLVAFHYGEQLQALQKYEPKADSPFDRVRELLLFRLARNDQLGAGRLSEAIALTLRDGSAARPASLLAAVADEIWYKAGDRSTDTQWYTRRGALTGVYAALEAFQARDGSQNMRDTRALANRLVSALETTEYAESSVAQWLDFNARAALNVLRTWR